MTSVGSLGNQELAELNDEIVLVRLKLPADLLCSRPGQFLGKFLQCFSQFFVLGEDRAQMTQRRSQLGPNPRNPGVSIISNNGCGSSRKFIQIVILSLEFLQEREQGGRGSFARYRKSSCITQQANLVLGTQQMERLA